MNVISPAKISIFLESINNNPPTAKFSLELIKNKNKAVSTLSKAYVWLL